MLGRRNAGETECWADGMLGRRNAGEGDAGEEEEC